MSEQTQYNTCQDANDDTGHSLLCSFATVSYAQSVIFFHLKTFLCCSSVKSTCLAQNLDFWEPRLLRRLILRNIYLEALIIWNFQFPPVLHHYLFWGSWGHIYYFPFIFSPCSLCSPPIFLRSPHFAISQKIRTILRRRLIPQGFGIPSLAAPNNFLTP